MHALTERDKRTLRIAAVAISIYLLIFYGLRVRKFLEVRRTEYQQLVKDAHALRQQLQPYENKALLIAKLKETYRIDLSKLSKSSLVGEASAAIQKAAQTGGVQLGPIRESPGNISAKELVSMQLEGAGPAPSVILLLHQLENLGYPLILDSVQINSDAANPGVVKVTLHLVILDFDQWKEERKRNA